MKKGNKFFRTGEFRAAFILTVCVMVLNYVAYYADDLVYAYQRVPHETFFTGLCHLFAAPVTLYVEAFESHYYLHVFFIGRVLNYCIEFMYFFVLTALVYIPFLRIAKRRKIPS
jgi:hypothetical protein